MNEKNNWPKLGIIVISIVLVTGALVGQHYGSILLGSGIGLSLGVSLGLLIDLTQWLSH